MSEENSSYRIVLIVVIAIVVVVGAIAAYVYFGREPFQIELPAILRRAAELGVAVEHNAYPDRLDLCDRDLRHAKELGCNIVINTDAHHTSHMEKMRYGIRQLRRAWLRKQDVLNTLGAREFLAALRPRPV